jgi:hypothetical protein
MKLNLAILSAALYLVAQSLPALADDANARGIFFEQLKKPQERINTGVSYWVELEREGKTSRVSNKTAFVENDKVRFHFTPNFDGYAYILMIEGSKGEKTVLFPSAEAPVNKVAAGTEIVLPYAKGKEAWLKFDDNPGTEVVRIIVSRDQIDPKEQLSSAKPTKADVVMSAGGAQTDKVPSGTYVSMNASGDNSSLEVASSNAGRTGETAGKAYKEGKDGKGKSKTDGTNAAAGSRALNLDVAASAPDQASRPGPGEVTVVSKDATKQLAIDITLDHKKHQ